MAPQQTRMTVRFGITIGKDVPQRLRRELPAKGIRLFSNDAIQALKRPSRKALDEAYKAAGREPWRKAEAREWEITDIEVGGVSLAPRRGRKLRLPVGRTRQ